MREARKRKKKLGAKPRTGKANRTLQGDVN